MCRSRFGVLYYLSEELNQSEKNNVIILGISNKQHSESEIPKMIEGISLPWVHDNTSQDVWTKWDARLRDLYIVNEEGILYGMVNLTNFDPNPQINGGQNYNDLKQFILDAKTKN
tara:strand:+ start:870 stop:1214 length:345 start_codon:yes stop_codon:yes gene_type:complete